MLRLAIAFQEGRSLLSNERVMCGIIRGWSSLVDADDRSTGSGQENDCCFFAGGLA